MNDMTPQYVVGFHFDSRREFVTLIEKKRPAWQEGKLNGPGGKVEPGESPHQAISREFSEEAGATIPPEAWRWFASLKTKDGSVVHFLAATRNANVRTMTDERVSVYNLGIVSDPGHALIPNLRWLIPMALDDSNGWCALYDPGVLTDVPVCGPS